MHKAAKQARAARLMELSAATATSQGTYDTEVRLSNLKLCKATCIGHQIPKYVTVWLQFSVSVYLA